MRALPCPLQESCVLVRLCDGSNGGWSPTSVAGGDRRLHARMSGDRSGPFVYRSRCRGCVAVPVRRTWHPEHIRSDNGPEFVSKVICRWLKAADVKTLFIAKGSPWENGYVESFNGTLRDELLNREIFLSFEEACWVIDRWRLDYNHHRIHSSLDYQTHAAYAAGCVLPASATPQPPEHSRFTNPNPLTQLGAKTGG